MKARAPNIRPFAANGHFSLYYRPFFSLSSYEKAVILRITAFFIVPIRKYDGFVTSPSNGVHNQRVF